MPIFKRRAAGSVTSEQPNLPPPVSVTGEVIRKEMILAHTTSQVVVLVRIGDDTTSNPRREVWSGYACEHHHLALIKPGDRLTRTVSKARNHDVLTYTVDFEEEEKD